MQLRGTDPQTGEEIDNWYVQVAMLPLLLIEKTLSSLGRQGLHREF